MAFNIPFVAATDYLSWMNNGIRQFVAVVIVFAGTKWLLERKNIQYILLVLFASLFHQTALLMIPIGFILQGKAWNIKTLLLLLQALLRLSLLTDLPTFLIMLFRKRNTRTL